MALKDKWVDKVDGVDIASAEDINQVAQAVIELEIKTDGIKVPTKLSELTGDATHRTVTDDEKTAWDAKLGQSDLQAATNAALKQAKESGEFNGKDYVLTEADKTEIAEEAAALVDTSGFVAKNQGAANVGKILVVGTDGNLVLADMPEGGANGDVVGVLDDANNILLTGALANGTYILKYEYEDGTVAEVGTLEVGEIPEPEPDPEATNFADPTSEDWLTDCRLSFSGSSLTTKPLTGAIVTNFITGIQVNDIVKVEGINFTESNNRQALLKVDGTVVAVVNADTLSGYSTHIGSVSYDNNTLQFTVVDTIDVKKLRFSGMPTGTAQDVKITITRNGKVL